MGLAGQSPRPLQPSLRDPAGKPFNPARKLIGWNGTEWTGVDVPDFKVDSPPEAGMDPFIMNAEGVARFFARDQHGGGSVPGTLRAVRVTTRLQPLESEQAGGDVQSRRRVFEDDREAFGKVDHFPHVATTYRLTEHFHYWTKHVRLNAILQPEQFVEIGEALAKDIGVDGDEIQVTSNRGVIVAVAVVTKRIRALDVDGKKVHTVGIPIHWGFTGLAKPGYLANTLTPFVGDANAQTPEFKAFLVNVEKA